MPSVEDIERLLYSVDSKFDAIKKGIVLSLIRNDRTLEELDEEVRCLNALITEFYVRNKGASLSSPNLKSSSILRDVPNVSSEKRNPSIRDSALEHNDFSFLNDAHTSTHGESPIISSNPRQDSSHFSIFDPSPFPGDSPLITPKMPPIPVDSSTPNSPPCIARRRLFDSTEESPTSSDLSMFSPSCSSSSPHYSSSSPLNNRISSPGASPASSDDSIYLFKLEVKKDQIGKLTRVDW